MPNESQEGHEEYYNNNNNQLVSSFLYLPNAEFLHVSSRLGVGFPTAYEIQTWKPVSISYYYSLISSSSPDLILPPSYHTMPAPAMESTRTSKLVVSVLGIMATLLIYGILQEKIMRVPYGKENEYFKYSLFLVLCNRVLTCSAAAAFLMATRKTMSPVAPLYKYGAISVSNILTTTCQYEALKYVSFPVQTLAKSAKMIPVMVWGTIIMQKRYTGRDYTLAVLVTLGCALFILFPESDDITPYNKGRESTVWGVLLMIGYLGFDGFTSTFQDKLFRGYNMEIYNQVFYTTLCSCAFSMAGLLIQGHLLQAIAFVSRHMDCLLDVILLSTVATASQFFISYTIRTFGALTFATIMTTRQLVSILLSCIWFVHPLSWKQWMGAVAVFAALYCRSFFNSQKKRTELPKQQEEEVEKVPLVPTEEKAYYKGSLSVEIQSRQ